MKSDKNKKNIRLLMGNEAIALGAIRAGVRVVTGYPGTPSTEILETVAKENTGDIYVEWSVNEKIALEIAAGAAYAGARTMVTMKQVGLNVAADPIMSLAYVGVKGGMVVVVADDPGPISSQTEQDTRHFAEFANLPVFDPSSPEEAYLMLETAFEVSERYGTPVLLRPTTRVCHGCAGVELLPPLEIPEPEGFVRDPSKWVIFPRLSYQSHLKIAARQPILGAEFSRSPHNSISDGQGRRGIATGGISYEYVREALTENEAVPLLKLGTSNPFPEQLALEFLQNLDEVLVLEELDPVVERALLQLVGKHHLQVTIRGKLSGDTRQAGENSVESVTEDLARYLETANSKNSPSVQQDSEGMTESLVECPSLPVRPPVLCAGCPHRASFYAIKRATRGKKTVYCGDIGCYTLGNAKPLEMVDTCLCMGADVTIAQGIGRIEPDTAAFSFIGDSTFFASGIPGVVNAVYNQSDLILIVLDNHTTAMTGCQPHPGTGETMMGSISEKISIEKILRAIGVASVEEIDPLDQTASIAAVKRALDLTGVRAIIFKSPCIVLERPAKRHQIIREDCTNCQHCLKQLGCPAIMIQDGNVEIEPELCTGCDLCAKICPTKAIVEVQA